MKKILDILNESILHDDICPKCGKHKNGVLRPKSTNFKTLGFRVTSPRECIDGYQNKEEAGLCTCED